MKNVNWQKLYICLMRISKHILKSLYEREKDLSTQLEATRNAIIGFGGKLNEIQTNVETKVSIPKKFNKELSWKEKVLFALNIIKQGYVEDITKELIKHEKMTYDKLFINVRFNASLLGKTGDINAKKVGKKNKYSVK